MTSQAFCVTLGVPLFLRQSSRVKTQREIRIVLAWTSRRNFQLFFSLGKYISESVAFRQNGYFLLLLPLFIEVSISDADTKIKWAWLPFAARIANSQIFNQRCVLRLSNTGLKPANTAWIWFKWHVGIFRCRGYVWWLRGNFFAGFCRDLSPRDGTDGRWKKTSKKFSRVYKRLSFMNFRKVHSRKYVPQNNPLL